MKIDPVKIACRAVAGFAVVALAGGFTYLVNTKTGLPLKWPAGTVTMLIKLGTSPTLSDGGNFTQSVQAAIQTWNPVLGSLQIQSQVHAVSAAGDGNNLNEIAFSDTVFGKAFDTNVLAVTTTWSQNNQRTEADIIFNSARTWDSYRGALQANAYDLQRVAVHELGHVLGLDHPDEAGQTVSAIMNSHVSNIETLTHDDLTGAQNLYGPPGVPANDDFAAATVITLVNNAAQLTGYNTNATKESDEPNHAGNPGGRSVWWKWTPQLSGSVTIDSRGSYFDTTMAVYTGTAVNSLKPIASNDDINPSIVQTSSVTFDAVAGTTYAIAVDGFDGDSGGVMLNLAYTAGGASVPSITGQPASVTAVAGGTVTLTVTATGATPLTYQWYFGNAAVAGGAGATLTLSKVGVANAGSYTVMVSNAAGSITSDPATVVVNSAPASSTSSPASPSSGGSAASGGGGGGGGAPSSWFLLAVALLGAARRFCRSKR